MPEKTQFLPESALGQTVGVLGGDPGKFAADLRALGCKTLDLFDGSDLELSKEADFFVLDASCYLDAGAYPEKINPILKSYAAGAANRYCYSIFPYANMNYDWDVTNLARPADPSIMLPATRWIYDTLLDDFAARAIANIRHGDAVPCIVTRLLPLKRTLLCIMASSGSGKTTLVRLLANRHRLFHTSSDYLLNNILSVSGSVTDNASLSQLRSAIDRIPSEKLWGRFFRLLEEDHLLLESFLELAWQHMQLAGEGTLLSLDIDLRTEEGRAALVAFFRKKDLKVWECTT